MWRGPKETKVISIESHRLKGITMTETLAFARQRVVTPLATTVIALALIAALALGFGIRAWTESSPAAATSTPVVHTSSIPSTGSAADGTRRISGPS
jgi:hypothetical protein